MSCSHLHARANADREHATPRDSVHVAEVRSAEPGPQSTRISHDSAVPRVPVRPRNTQFLLACQDAPKVTTPEGAAAAAGVREATAPIATGDTAVGQACTRGRRSSRPNASTPAPPAPAPAPAPAPESATLAGGHSQQTARAAASRAPLSNPTLSSRTRAGAAVGCATAAVAYSAAPAPDVLAPAALAGGCGDGGGWRGTADSSCCQAAHPPMPLPLDNMTSHASSGSGEKGCDMWLAGRRART